MIQILLNNTEVYPKQGQTIKMTKENPALTKSGTYSLDIEFSLDVPANRFFFGALNRVEARKDYREYAAVIRQNGAAIVTGTAIVTKATEGSVTVQLVETRTSSTSIDMMQYIDNLNLGKFWFDPKSLDTWEMQETWNKSKVLADDDERCAPEFQTGYWFDKKLPQGYLVNENGNIVVIGRCAYSGLQYMGKEGKAVFVPVYNETHKTKGNVSFPAAIWYDTKYYTDDATLETLQTPTCMMPSFNLVIQRVFGIYGFTVNLGVYAQAPWSNLYIANAHSTTGINYTLPHWTIKDFVVQVELFYGCTININEVSRTVTLASRTGAAGYGATKRLETVVDEFEAEIDSDEEEDDTFLSTSNIEYSLSDSQAHVYDKIDSDMFKRYEVRTFGSYAEMQSCYDTLSDDEKKKLIFSIPSGFYCRRKDDLSSDFVLGRIHHFGNLIRNTTTDDAVELKICPVATEIVEQKVMYNYYGGNDYDPGDVLAEIGTMKVTRIRMEDKRTYVSEMSKNNVWDAIQDKDTEFSYAEDRIQVFFFEGLFNKRYTAKDKSVRDDVVVKTFEPFTDENYKLIPSETNRPSWSLSINANTAQYSVAKLLNIQNGTDSTQRRVVSTFQFLSTTPPDVSQIFMIRGKKYLCEKVEYDIEDDGINPLMTGYFYEITDSR